MDITLEEVFNTEEERVLQYVCLGEGVSDHLELSNHRVVRLLEDSKAYVMVHGIVWVKLLDTIAMEGLINEPISTIANSIGFDETISEFLYKGTYFKVPLGSYETFPEIEVRG